jgi:hypothetical protein
MWSHLVSKGFIFVPTFLSAKFNRFRCLILVATCYGSCLKHYNLHDVDEHTLNLTATDMKVSGLFIVKSLKTFYNYFKGMVVIAALSPGQPYQMYANTRHECLLGFGAGLTMSQ